MNEPNPGSFVPLQLLRHIHLVSSHHFPRLPKHELGQMVDWLIQAPRITKEQAPMNWQFVNCPPDGEVVLVWQPPQLGIKLASDGYVWADAEAAFSSEMKGYIVEMHIHKSGFRPPNEPIATHSRRRFRLTPVRNPDPSLPPPDESLWLVYYSQTEPHNQFPSNRIQVNEQIRQELRERQFLQQQGQLVRKEFMLRDSASWPTINLPGNTSNTNPPYMQQALGYPGDVISHMNRSQQQAYIQQQQAAASQRGIGPPQAKRPRHGAPSFAHPSATSLPAPVVAHDIVHEEEEGTSGGDYMDFLTPRDISIHRYVQHHEWLEEILNSQFDTRQIIPGELGLGRKGELESLTKDFFDAPTEATPKEKLEPPTGSSPMPDSATPRVGRLDPGKAENFTKRATEKVAEINAEMDKLKRQHAGRMAKLNRGQAFREAEQDLRVSTLDMINGDTSKTGPERQDRIDDISRDLEARVGKSIKPVKEVECIQKGGLEEKTVSGNGSDQDYDMLSTATPYIALPDSVSQPSHMNPEGKAADTPHVPTEMPESSHVGDIKMVEVHGSPTLQGAGTEEWVMVNKEGQPPEEDQGQPDLDNFANDIATQPRMNTPSADNGMGSNDIQGFEQGTEGEDPTGNFDTNDFGEGIDFGD